MCFACLMQFGSPPSHQWAGSLGREHACRDVSTRVGLLQVVRLRRGNVKSRGVAWPRVMRSPIAAPVRRTHWLFEPLNQGGYLLKV